MKCKWFLCGCAVLMGVVVGLTGCDIASTPATSGTTSAPEEDSSNPSTGSHNAGSPSASGTTQ
jgi:hypothetical protein